MSNVIDAKITEHSEYFHEKFEQLSELFTEKDKGKIEKVFRNGVRVYIKSHFRYLKDNFNIDEAYSEVSNPEYIDKQIHVYFFEFVQSLKSSQKNKETKKNSLELAERSYVLNPNTVKEMLERYPNEESAVKAFSRQNANPEKRMQEYLAKVKEMLEKYPDEIIKIKSCVLNYSDPKAALLKIIKEK